MPLVFMKEDMTEKNSKNVVRANGFFTFNLMARFAGYLFRETKNGKNSRRVTRSTRSSFLL